MKKIIATLLVLLITMNMHAVLKEKNLEQTLSILRTELTQKHQELNSLAEERKTETQEIINELKETMKQSNQCKASISVLKSLLDTMRPRGQKTSHTIRRRVAGWTQDSLP